MNRLDPDKHRMVLSTYGRHGDRLRELGKTHPAVEVVDFVPRHFLKFIDVHLVTLLDEWTHVCVPSKAVSAVCAGSAFMFCGSLTCDIWRILNRAGWYIQTGDGMISDLDRIWERIDAEAVESKKAQAVELARVLLNMRNTAFERIASTVVQKDH